jgi:hypothetical protein
VCGWLVIAIVLQLLVWVTTRNHNLFWWIFTPSQKRLIAVECLAGRIGAEYFALDSKSELRFDAANTFLAGGRSLNTAIENSSASSGGGVVVTLRDTKLSIYMVPCQWRLSLGSIYLDIYDAPALCDSRGTVAFPSSTRLKGQVPIWLSLLFSIAAFLVSWRGLRKARFVESRILNGLCFFCGYDLRASPDRCPECGKTRADASKPIS